MPSVRRRRYLSRLLRFGPALFALTLSGAVLTPTVGAAPRLAPRATGAGTPHAAPAKGPQLLKTVPPNAYPVHQGFGDPRFGVVEAFAIPKQAAALHVGWERIQVRWDLLQPQGPSQWDVNATKNDVPYNNEVQAGRQLVGVIQGVPAWAATNPKDGGGAVPKNLDLPWNDPRNYWGQFVFRAVRHYAGRIDTFVILNEVNIATGAYHQFSGTIAQYAQMLRVAYLAAHAANPHVEVHIYGDSVYADQGAWFSKTIAALAAFPDAKQNNYFFDAAEVHLYSSVLRWDTLMRNWHAAMKRYGFDRPIWLAETNVSPRDDKDPFCKCLANPADHNALLADQPSFIVDSFAAALGLGMPREEVYQMRDPRVIWPEHPNGLVRYDGSIRPEYYAFKTANTWFAGVFATKYQTCNSPYVGKTCLFRVTMERPGQEIVVLWNQGGRPITPTVTAVAPGATLVGPLGGTSSARPVAGTYRIALPAATDHGVASDKMFDIGSPPVIVVQNLPTGQHVPGLTPLFVEQDRFSGQDATLGPVTSVAVDPSGSGIRAIADTAHDRVLIQNPKTNRTTVIGGTGGAPGQFRGPAGVAIGADGTLYVADMGNARIEEFDLSGHLLGGFGTYGFDPGSLQAPTALAVAPDNSLYVVDAAQDAVLHFTRMGAFLSRFGSFGYGQRQFDGPGGIAIDAAGRIYVADTLNNRVVEFDGQGNPLLQFGAGGAGSDAKSLHWPTGVAVLHDGTVVIADTANQRVIKVAHPDPYLGAVDAGAAGTPGGLAIAPDGSYFVSDTAGNRIVHLDATGKVLGAFGSKGFGKGQFNGPLGLALGGDGNLYVADHNNNRIEVVTQSGAWVRHIGAQGHAPGQFVGPYAVSVAKDGSIWVADNGNARVEHLTAGGGVLGVSATHINGVWGVAADSDGGVYYSAHWGWGPRIFHLDSAGHQQSWGAKGSGAGEFDGPGALAVTPDGATIYAADEGNHRVQFISGGQVAGARGGANDGPSGLGDPVAVAVAADGSIAVLDAARHRIVRYAGAGAGAFDVAPVDGLPLGVGGDGTGTMTVAVTGAWTGLTAAQTLPVSSSTSSG